MNIRTEWPHVIQYDVILFTAHLKEIHCTYFKYYLANALYSLSEFHQLNL